MLSATLGNPRHTLKKKGACFSLSPVPMLVTTATLETPFSFIAVIMLVVPDTRITHVDDGPNFRAQQIHQAIPLALTKQNQSTPDGNSGCSGERHRRAFIFVADRAGTFAAREDGSHHVAM